MRRDGDGVWTVVGSPVLAGRGAISTRCEVFAPTTGRVETNLVTDPYSVALTAELDRVRCWSSLSDPALTPPGWSHLRKPAAVSSPPLARSMSCTSATSRSVTRRCPPRIGAPTWRSPTRRSAGMTPSTFAGRRRGEHLHLLPVFDFATVPERRADQAVPACDLAVVAAGLAGRSRRAWSRSPTDGRLQLGLRPVALHDARGLLRGRPGRRRPHPRVPPMVAGHQRRRPAGRHGRGLQPHDRVRPGPEVGARPDRARLLPAADPATGTRATSTCCANTATEHRMMDKLMVDSVVTWARDYKVDGFRFDLMGHHSKANMLAVRHALDELTLRATASTAGRSALRRGLELRRGRQRRPLRAGHPGEHGRHRHRARSPTGCATPCAAAARSTPTRASRASAPACSPTPTATRSTARPPSSRLACCYYEDLIKVGPGRQPGDLPLRRRAPARSSPAPRSTTTASRPATRRPRPRR